jgi:hypothetical protein
MAQAGWESDPREGAHYGLPRILATSRTLFSSSRPREVHSGLVDDLSA